jgi:hypothetical protein
LTFVKGKVWNLPDDGTQTSDDRKSNLAEHEMTNANTQEYYPLGK